MVVYVAGSMKNQTIPSIANRLRARGHEAFDDWFSPGPEADDHWQAHEKARGRSFREALAGYHARDVYRFDLEHLTRADVIVLVLPAGKSAHMELGWMIGKGKPGYILLNGEPDRYDIMYNFATGIVNSIDELLERLK